MEFDFSDVTAIEIPEGNVTKIEDSYGNVLWEAVSGVNIVIPEYIPVSPIRQGYTIISDRLSISGREQMEKTDPEVDGVIIKYYDLSYGRISSGKTYPTSLYYNEEETLNLLKQYCSLPNIPGLNKDLVIPYLGKSEDGDGTFYTESSIHVKYINGVPTLEQGASDISMIRVTANTSQILLGEPNFMPL